MDRALRIAQRLADGEVIDWERELEGASIEEREDIEALRDLAGVSEAQRQARAEAEKPLPERIDEFRILRRIGEGGMGLVLEAEQQRPQRLVALKIIRGGFVSREQVRMFQREIQTLALLNHPGIASIFASGLTEDGEHWFAMELVRGQTLREWQAERPQLDRRELATRLRLFQQICDAVAYAHQRGVIHRDLKPSNVLVLEGNRVKVLDFGLARITDSDVAAASLSTQAGRVQGTLHYMSPEQARGDSEQIDLRSDVYSLGVVLYELLSGELPHEFRSGELFGSLQTIAQKPIRSLRSVWPHGRAPDEDLQTIVHEALRGDPEERYGSVLALAGDVERYLANQPILARPPSAGYQLRKLVARHPLPAALLATLLLALLGFSIAMTWQAGVIRRERDAARQEANAARRATDMMVELFALSDPMQRRGEGGPSAVELLEQGIAQIDQIQEDDPLLRARLLDALGRSFLNLSRYREAEAPLREAAQLRMAELEPPHPDLRQSLSDLARLEFQLGDYARADSLAQSALAMLHRLPADPAAEAMQLQQLGTIHLARGELASAGAELQQANERMRSLPDVDVLERGKCLLGLAEVHTREDDYEQASDAYRETLALYQRELAPNHPHLLFVRSAYSLLLMDMHELARSREQIEAALAVVDGGSYGEPDRYVAHVLDSAVELELEESNYAAARPLAERSIELCTNIFGAEHPRVAYSWTQLGRIAAGMNENGAARDAFQRALEIYAAHPDLAPAFREQVLKELERLEG